MKSSVEALEGNRVKLSVEVGEDEFEVAVDAAFRRIAHEVRIPGFRPGKAPRKILEARLGTDAARQEALREALPGYFTQAAVEHEVDVIAAPEIDITAGRESGPVAFDAVVEVRPRITVVGYDGLRVEVPAPRATDEDVDAQVDRLRGASAALEPVDRAAVDGDHVTLDIAGSLGGDAVEGLTADDYLYEVGSGSAVPELDDHLRGAKAGDILGFEAAHPDPAEEQPLSFRVLVKQIQRKVLPDATDEWASEASEFETLAELRDDLRTRVEAVKRVSTVLALRSGVVDALVGLVQDEPPEALVDGEVERRVHDLAHRLSHQNATIDDYLEATGTSAQELVDRLRVEAVRTVKADLALRAVIDAEAIEASDQEVEAEVARLAAQLEQPLERVHRDLERGGALQAVRSDAQRTKALEWLADHAEVVDPEGNPVDRSLLEPPATADGPGPQDPTDQNDEEQG